jgi:5-formyltetrahydrofolate cyclo-ligase
MNAANTAGFGAEKKSRRAHARAARRALSPSTRDLLAQKLAAQAMKYLAESTDTAIPVGVGALEPGSGTTAQCVGPGG